MSSDDLERQQLELDAIESIFDDSRLFLRTNTPVGGKLFVPVKFPENVEITHPKLQNEIPLNDERQVDREEKEDLSVLKIKHLPPIAIKFELPSDYPSLSMPVYSLSCKWLTPEQLTKLCNCLDEIWVKDEVLYNWYQMLSDSTCLILGITSNLQLSAKGERGSNSHIDKRVLQDNFSLTSLLDILVEYDNAEEKRLFQISYYHCSVCFEKKPGSACIQFPKCQHVYCAICMRNYFNMQISDGAVKALTCPENKCEVQADPHIVKALVNEETFRRYDELLLQRTLDCMSDIVNCPRKSCQSVVLKEETREMGRCPKCGFVFCILCNNTYHGAASCPISSKDVQNLRQKYLNGTEEERAELERRYGKEKLKQLLEEGYSEEWLNKFTKECPSCRANVQKIDGCNKMTCFSCRENFCWLCQQLLKGDPYQHFNSSNSICNNKLFEGMELELEDFEDDGWINFIG